jgi:hypothetical protein
MAPLPSGEDFRRRRWRSRCRRTADAHPRICRLLPNLPRTRQVPSSHRCSSPVLRLRVEEIACARALCPHCRLHCPVARPSSVDDLGDERNGSRRHPTTNDKQHTGEHSLTDYERTTSSADRKACRTIPAGTTVNSTNSNRADCATSNWDAVAQRQRSVDIVHHY